MYNAASSDGGGAKQSMVLPKIGDVIESLGAGPFLVNQVSLGASIWLASGTLIVIVSAVTLAISAEWSLEGWQRSAAVSVIFLGLMIGNFASGPCSDSIGRRLPILISLTGVVVCSISSAMATDFWILCALRFALGVCCGFSQPTWTTLCTEITPISWRMVAHVASETYFVIGEIFGGCVVWLDDPTMKNLSWRLLTLVSAAPAAIMGTMCIFFLKESAAWLALQQQTDRARDVLKSVQWWNGKEQMSIDFEPSQKSVAESAMGAFQKQMSTAMGGTLGFTTFVLCFSCFVLNFSYYGSYYAFPLVLGHKVDLGISPAAALIVGALWEFPGFLLAIPLTEVCSRRVSAITYLSLMMVATIMFVEGSRLQKNTGGDFAYFLVYAGFAGMKCFINTGYIIIYQYVSEVYPTCARVAGSGISFGFGRVGSMAAPFVFEGMMASFNDRWETFFFAIVVLGFLNIVLILFLPFETFGMTLKDYVEDMGEMDPLVSCDCTGRKVPEAA